MDVGIVDCNGSSHVHELRSLNDLVLDSEQVRLLQSLDRGTADM